MIIISIRFELSIYIYQKGALDSNDQIILVDWYNSLTSKGSLNWNTTIDLCGQTGVVCDSSNPQRVIQL